MDKNVTSNRKRRGFEGFAVPGAVATSFSGAITSRFALERNSLSGNPSDFQVTERVCQILFQILTNALTVRKLHLPKN
jgi:hypothetical protein